MPAELVFVVAQLLKKSACLIHLICDQTSPAARDSKEVARAFNRRCYAHTRNDEHSWFLSISLTLSVGVSIQEVAMDVTRSAPRGSQPRGRYLPAHVYGNKEGSVRPILLWVRSTSTHFSTSIRYTPLNNTPLHLIPSVTPVGLLLKSHTLSTPLSSSRYFKALYIPLLQLNAFSSAISS